MKNDEFDVNETREGVSSSSTSRASASSRVIGPFRERHLADPLDFFRAVSPRRFSPRRAMILRNHPRDRTRRHLARARETTSITSSFLALSEQLITRPLFAVLDRPSPFASLSSSPPPSLLPLPS